MLEGLAPDDVVSFPLKPPRATNLLTVFELINAHQYEVPASANWFVNTSVYVLLANDCGIVIVVFSVGFKPVICPYWIKTEPIFTYDEFVAADCFNVVQSTICDITIYYDFLRKMC